jgi:uncharacterized protein with HEPN domain
MIRTALHRLYDIHETLESALAAVQGKTALDLEMDWVIRAALQHALVVIGEAVKTLPDHIKSPYPQIPWNDIVGMGVRVKHHYHHIDGLIIWDTVTNDFPNLLPIIKKMVADNEVTSP